MALGMTIVIISGGIDLSVGSILGMGGLIGTMALESGYPIVVAYLIGIAVGNAVRSFNGLMVTRLKIPPFVVTLGTLGIFRGAGADLFERPAGSSHPAGLFVSRRR